MAKWDIEDQELISTVMATDKKLETRFMPMFQDMNDAANMANSKYQWKKEDKDYLDSQDRVANAYNLISPIIKVIAGIERGNRKKISILGRSSGDQQKSKLLTQLAGFQASSTDFDSVKSRIFLDTIMMKMGYGCSSWSFDNDPVNGQYLFERVNPLEMKFDVANPDVSWKKVRFVSRKTWVSLEDIINQYALDDDKLYALLMEKSEVFRGRLPQNEKKGLIQSMLQSLWDSVGDILRGEQGYREHNDPNSTLQDWYDPKNNLYALTEFSERVTVRAVTAYHSDTNEKFDITDVVKGEGREIYDRSLTDQYLQSYPNSRIDVETINRIDIKTVVPALGACVYNRPQVLQNGNFKYTPFFCYDWHPDITKIQSVVDELIDPQSDYNKRRSTILEMLMRLNALGTVFEEGAIDGFEDQWTNKTVGGNRFIRQGYWERWKNDQSVTIPQEFYIENQESKALLEEISGVPKAARGMSESREETGKLFLAKKQQSELSLTYLFDNYDTSTLQAYRNMVDLIQIYMTEEQEIRVLDEEDNPFFFKINEQVLGEIKNDVSIGKYDVVISQQPYGSSAREIEYMKLLDIIKFIVESAGPNAAILALPILVKASDSAYRNELLLVLKQLTGISDIKMQMELFNEFMQGQALKSQMKANESKQLQPGQTSPEQPSPTEQSYDAMDYILQSPGQQNTFENAMVQGQQTQME